MAEERIAGFQAQFQGAEANTVLCQAGLYRSLSGAMEAMSVQTMRLEARVDAGEITGQQASAPDELGDEAWALSGQNGDVEAFVLVWRSANVLSSCTIVGDLATDQDNAVLIARAQQTRIDAAAA